MFEGAQVVQIVGVLALTLLATLVVVRAQREADSERKSARKEAQELRDEAHSLLMDAQRREELIALRERESAEDQRSATNYAREIEQRVAVVAREEKKLLVERDKLRAAQLSALADISKLKVGAAKERLLKEIVAEAESAAQSELRRIDKRVQTEANERARAAIIDAMQRVAAETTTQRAATWLPLPSEEMRGRIIGRDGRNIRAFEALTGVNLLVEDGVNAVMLSSFDVERREIAEVTLNALFADGRIQPSRIESAFAEATEKATERHVEAGLDAAEAAGVTGLDAEIIETLGRLRLRSSYGQNVLRHIIECAELAAGIAVELGADEALARRAAFLHDIGKARTGEQQGTHAAIGAALLRKHGESAAVVNAVAAHHDEQAPTSVEAVIVQIADTVSAARPGARREDADDYAKRLTTLEESILAMPGVADVRAMSDGREVRVIVSPEKVPDSGVNALARTIAQRIADDPNHPGEVKVTVIRETRADAVAG